MIKNFKAMNMLGFIGGYLLTCHFHLVCIALKTPVREVMHLSQIVPHFPRLAVKDDPEQKGCLTTTVLESIVQRKMRLLCFIGLHTSDARYKYRG